MDEKLQHVAGLIRKIPKFRKTATPDEILDIIKQGHVHYTDAFLEYPGIWKMAYVTDLALRPHRIQVVWQSPTNYTCFCRTCQGLCPQAIAAFCVIYVKEIFPKESKQTDCAVCAATNH